MAQTSADISNSIRTSLRILDPDIATDPLTPERKIIDTVSDAIANAGVDTFIQNYVFDIDTKVGADLDKFVALFGFARQGGRNAMGTVTFSRSATATSDIIIPAGTQVVKPATSVSNAVVFQTTINTTIYTGTTSAVAPIECIVAGVVGNVPSYSINTISNISANGVSQVLNNDPTSGGTSPEDDATLRVRFKNTIFRNIAGTSDQFLALAIASQFADRANVIGPTSRFIEYLQITASGSFISVPSGLGQTHSSSGGALGAATYYYKVTAVNGNGETTASSEVNTGALSGSANQVTLTWTAVAGASSYKVYRGTTTGGENIWFAASTNSYNDLGTASGTGGTPPGSNTASIGSATSIIPYSQYTYNFDYWLTNGDFTNEIFYTPNGSDYTFSNTVPPSITINNTANIPNGSIVLLEHTYTSLNSRNVPSTSVMNNVDVYVSGVNYDSATEACIFPSSSNNFVSSPTSSNFYTGKYLRSETDVAPTAGNTLQILMWQPATGLPGTITIGSNTYTQDTDYWLVRDTTLKKGSRRAWNGIEWSSTVAGAVAAGTSFTINYQFDKLPLTLNELMEAHKQISTDVLVHGALNRFYNVALTVMYTPGFFKSAVDAAISTSLTSLLQGLQFGAVIQVSDILQAVHEVPGVDNVRLTTSTENATTYGIQEISPDGNTVLNTYTSDFGIQDSDLPVLFNVTTIAKSQNTWANF